MSFHHRVIAPGAQTVARMDEIDARDARFVAALRLYLSGPEGQEAIWNGFAGLLGAAAGRRAMQLFEGYLTAIADGAPRPLHRHRPGCACLGQDEAAIAAVLRCAGAGEDARAIATAGLIARPQACAGVAMAAAALAEALDRVEEATARREPFRRAAPPARRTLH